MKKSQKVFFAVVCAGLLFACSKTEWVKSKNVTVAWEAPTSLKDGTPISKDRALRYNVYIDRDTDKTHDDKELLTAEPIAATRYTISSIEHKGKYWKIRSNVFDKKCKFERYKKAWAKQQKNKTLTEAEEVLLQDAQMINQDCEDKENEEWPDDSFDL